MVSRGKRTHTNLWKRSLCVVISISSDYQAGLFAWSSEIFLISEVNKKIYLPVGYLNPIQKNNIKF